MSESRIHEHPWADDVAAYALDALDGPERTAFEAHLAACERCRTEMAEMADVAAALATVVPPVAPPPALRERVLADARQVSPIDAARARPRTAAPRRAFSGAAWLTAAASLALALFAGWGYLRERAEREELAARYEEARIALAERDSLLAGALSPRVETIQLTAGERAPTVRLYWNRQRDVVVLAAADLPSAPAGRTYQLWGIAAGGTPVSLGTFDTAAGGDARVVLPVPPGLELAVSAITEEPAGGSPQPTTTPFLAGEWGA